MVVEYNGISFGSPDSAEVKATNSGINYGGVMFGEGSPAYLDPPTPPAPAAKPSAIYDVATQVAEVVPKVTGGALGLVGGLLEAGNQLKFALTHPLDAAHIVKDTAGRIYAGSPVGKHFAEKETQEKAWADAGKTPEQLILEKQTTDAENMTAGLEDQRISKEIQDQRNSSLAGPTADWLAKGAAGFTENLPAPETKAGKVTALVADTGVLVGELLAVAVTTKGLGSLARIGGATEGVIKTMEVAAQGFPFAAQAAQDRMLSSVKKGKTWEEATGDYYVSLGLNEAAMVPGVPRFTGVLAKFPQSKIAQLTARAVQGGLVATSMTIEREVEQGLLSPEDGSALKQAFSKDGIREILPLALATMVTAGRFRTPDEIKNIEFGDLVEKAAAPLKAGESGEMKYAGLDYRVSIMSNGAKKVEPIKKQTNLMQVLDGDHVRFQSLVQGASTLYGVNESANDPKNPEAPRKVVLADNIINVTPEVDAAGNVVNLNVTSHVTDFDGKLVTEQDPETGLTVDSIQQQSFSPEQVWGVSVRGKIHSAAEEGIAGRDVVTDIVATDEKAQVAALADAKIEATVKGQKLEVPLTQITTLERAAYLANAARRKLEFAVETTATVHTDDGLPVGTDVIIGAPDMGGVGVITEEVVRASRVAELGASTMSTGVVPDNAVPPSRTSLAPADVKEQVKDMIAKLREKINSGEGRLKQEQDFSQTTVEPKTQISMEAPEENVTFRGKIRDRVNSLTPENRIPNRDENGRLYELSDSAYPMPKTAEERAAENLSLKYGVSWQRGEEGRIVLSTDEVPVLKGNKQPSHKVAELFRTELRNVQQEDFMSRTLFNEDVDVMTLSDVIDSYVKGNPKFTTSRGKVEQGLREANSLLWSQGYQGVDLSGKTPAEAEQGLLRIVNSFARAFEAANGLPEDAWYEVMFAADPVKAINELGRVVGKGELGNQQVEGWHGTTEIFDAFDSSKIGSGAGLQEGWGHYVSQFKDTARYFAWHLAHGAGDVSKQGVVYDVTINNRPGTKDNTWMDWSQAVGYSIAEKVLPELSRLYPNLRFTKDTLFKKHGKQIYRLMSDKLGIQGASKLLWDLGIDGNRFLGESTPKELAQLRSLPADAKFSYVVFDSSLLKVNDKSVHFMSDLLMMKGDKRVLGETIWKDGKAVINFYKGSDIQTGLHEIGHVWRRSISDRDLRAITAWAFGSKNDDPAQWSGEGSVVAQERARKAEEKFVKHFVSWVASPKRVAGSKELNTAFQNVGAVLNALRSSTRILPESKISPTMVDFMNRVAVKRLEPMEGAEKAGLTEAIGKAPKYIPGTNISALQHNWNAIDTKVLEEVNKFMSNPLDLGSYPKVAERRKAALERLYSDPSYRDQVMQNISEGRGNADDAAAIFEIFQREADEAVFKIRAAKTDVEREAVIRQLKESRDVFHARQDMAREAGQTLKMFDAGERNVIGKMRETVGNVKMLSALMQMEKLPGGEAKMKELMAAIQKGDVTYLDKLETEPTMRDYAHQIMYGNMMLAPKMWKVNFISTAMWTLWQIPHRTLAAGIDAGWEKWSKLMAGDSWDATKHQRKYFMSEIFPYLAGMKEGAGKGIAIGARALPILKRFLPELKAENVNDIMLYDMDKVFMDIHHNEYTALGRAVVPGSNKYHALNAAQKGLRLLNPLYQVGADVMRASDAVFRCMAFEAEKQAMAARKWEVSDKSVALDKFVKDYAPSDLEQLALKDYARYNIFTDMPGKFTRWVQSGREQNFFVKAFLPFFATIVNVAKRGIEMTPGFGAGFEIAQNVGRKKDLARSEGREAGVGSGLDKADKRRALDEYAGQNYQKYSDPTGHTAADIAAKQIEGSLLAAMMLFGLDDDQIQGPMPKDAAGIREMNAKGAIPYSVRLGKNWYGFQNLDPFAKVFKGIAVAKKAMRDWVEGGKDPENFDMGRYVGEIGNTIVTDLMDSSMFGTITNVMNGDGNKFSRALAGTAMNFVPMSGFTRWLGAQVNMLSNDGVLIPPDVDGALNKAISPTLWYLYGNLEGKKDVFGEPIARDSMNMFTFFLPVSVTPAKTNPVNEYCAKIGHFPAMPSETFTIGGRKGKFDKDIHAEYAVWYGQKLFAAMENVVQNEGLKKMPLAEQIKYLDNKIAEPIRRAGHGKALAAQSKKPGGIQAAMVPEEGSPFLE
jgi:hypothetical protein